MEDAIQVNSAEEFFDIMDGVTAKRESCLEILERKNSETQG